MGRVDFAIITALAEERDAVLAKLEGHQKLEKDGLDTHTYYEAVVPTQRKDGASYRVIITSLSGMGPLMATAKAQAVVARWHPTHVLLVGIACGLPKKTELGDVLIARQVADYTLGKVQSDGRREIRWDVHRAGPNLLDIALNLSPNDWIPLITGCRPNPGVPVRRCDVIASGGDVVSNAELINAYKADWSKLIGIEMEAGGVATGLHDTSEGPEFLMIKGVSDHGEGKHEVEDWRPYACDSAAAFALALIRSGVGPAVQPKERRVVVFALLLLLVVALAVTFGVRWRNAAEVRRHNDEGVAALQDGKYEAARKAFAAALAVDPSNAAAHASLAVLEEREGHRAQAINEAEASVLGAPRDALTRFNLGILLARADRLEDALASLQKSIDLDPDYERPYNEMGNIYLKLGRPADARRVLVAGLRRNPEFAPLSKNLARAALAEGRAEEAVRLLRDALRRYRDDRRGRAEATYWLASADAALNRQVEACAELARFRELDPTRLSEVAMDAQKLGRSQRCP